ncbi:MAG TPA: prepilin-type N-terminal cleavage/methylation domain-containing protein [Kiloniellaceae bacterium]|nr:prepilin-type N-terminal cleavage/methylation domain-containing protein [Kiloniellaceae bacterium]
MRSSDDAAGFTLIEVLIAFVIMTVMLGALFKAFSGGLRGLDASEGYAIAAMEAQSKLAEVGRSFPLEPGATSGEFESGAHWSLDISPFDLPNLSSNDEPPLLAYKVELQVTWDETRGLTFETLRLGEPE